MKKSSKREITPQRASSKHPLKIFLLVHCMMILLFGICFWITPEFTQESEPSTIESAGRDFAMYWASWQMLASGEPLYSLETTQEYRNDPVTGNNVLLNPPWCLWLVAPVSWLPYSLALKAWLFVNFLLIPITVFISLKIYRQPLPHPILLFFLCIFAPAISCWYYGQLSLGLTAITCLLLLCMQRKWDWLAGLCLALMTIKPHIYFLLAFTIGLYALFQFRWKIFAGFAISMLILLIPFALQGSAITDWIQWVRSGQPAVWMTPTIGTWIRILIPSDTPLPPEWPLTAVPLSALLLCFVWFYVNRRSDMIWESTSIPLISFSLITAPYSWAYDFSLLIVWHVLMIGALRQRNFSFPALAVSSSLFFVAQVSFIVGDMHYLIWFPVVVLTSWWFTRAHIHPCKSDESMIKS